MQNSPETQIIEVRKELGFEAAHFLPEVPENHKCRRLHGHSYLLTVVVSGPIDPRYGWLMDFADIKALCMPIIDQLDHRYLNEVEGLENPTAENIAQWVWQRLAPGLPILKEIHIREGCTSAVVYRGPAGSRSAHT